MIGNKSGKPPMIIVLKTTGMELVNIMMQPNLGDIRLMDQVLPIPQLQNSITANIANVANLKNVFIDDVLFFFAPHIVNKKNNHNAQNCNTYSLMYVLFN